MFGEPDHVSTGTLRNSFERRAVLIGGLQTGLGVLLAVRMGWIGVVQNAKYTTASESNRVNLTLIPPRRGLILDRNNVPLAANRSDYRVDLIPERVADVDKTIAELGRLLSLGPDVQRDLRDKMDKARGFQPVEVASGLDWDAFAAVSV
ncbi:MAG: penicillin-binding protein 2, partial [Novosphingobium sp.]